MTLSRTGTDALVMLELGEKLLQRRLGFNLTQAQLANAAGVSKRTLERLEAGESTQLTNFIRVLRALGLAHGLETLIPESTSSPIEQLKLQGKQRRRASSVRKPKAPTKPWTWNDKT